MVGGGDECNPYPDRKGGGSVGGGSVGGGCGVHGGCSPIALHFAKVLFNF